MRTWFILLGGMIVWFVHFLLLYSLASLLGSTLTARLGVGLVTIVCLLADAALVMVGIRLARSGTGDPERWSGSLGVLLAVLSLLAVAWQGTPAIIG